MSSGQPEPRGCKNWFPDFHVKPGCSLIFIFKGFFLRLVGFYMFSEVPGPAGLWDLGKGTFSPQISYFHGKST